MQEMLYQAYEEMKVVCDGLPEKSEDRLRADRACMYIMQAIHHNERRGLDGATELQVTVVGELRDFVRTHFLALKNPKMFYTRTDAVNKAHEEYAKVAEPMRTRCMKADLPDIMQLLGIIHHFMITEPRTGVLTLREGIEQYNALWQRLNDIVSGRLGIQRLAVPQAYFTL